MIRKLTSLLAALMLLATIGLLPASAEATLPDVTALYKTKDVTDTWDEADAVMIHLNGTSAEGLDADGVTLSDGLVSITAKGTYVLRGDYTGRIEVAADKEKDVRLVLDGLTITSPEGPALLIRSADKVVLTLAEGSVNTLTASTALIEGEDAYRAALMSCDDLSINGSGTLNVASGAGRGIACSNDLILANGTINVTSTGDGIRGKDSLLVLGGSVTVNAEGDALVSDDDTDATHGVVIISGGTLNLTTGGGAGEPVTVSQDFGMRGGWMQQTTTEGADTASMKGLKAATALYVLGGDIAIDSADDALHSQAVTIADGAILAKTGDDGVHADNDLTISGGSLTVTQSYEGLESTNITITGGAISVTSSDDGVNGSGGNDASGMGGGFGGRDRFSAGNANVTITGGVLFINAEGDGLDSNGSVTMTGGEVYVSGPTSSGNGALDYNSSFNLTGGILMAAGSKGMAQNVSSAEGQAAVMVSASGQAGQIVTVQDAFGNVLASFTPEKSWGCILVSAPGMMVGSACTVSCGESVVYSQAITTAVEGGGSGMGGGFGGRGGHGGRP